MFPSGKCINNAAVICFVNNHFTTWVVMLVCEIAAHWKKLKRANTRILAPCYVKALAVWFE